MNKITLLNKRPEGKATRSDFKITIQEYFTPKDSEIVLITTYVSVDPYLRGRMNHTKSYIPSFELNMAIQSGIIAEVVESENVGFRKGDFLSANLNWKEHQTSDGKYLQKEDGSAVRLSSYLDVLGMTGLAAHLLLTEIGVPKAKETIVGTGAGGAVGSVVGQIGKLLGFTVVGITGSDEKVTLVKPKFSFNEAINYNTTPELKEAIKSSCPKGVDIYFDNAGGEISDAVLANVNKYARLPVCGAISLYNKKQVSHGSRVQSSILTKSAAMRGFIIGDFLDKFSAATKQLTSWLGDEKLTYSETIVEGFKNIPQAFLDLFQGKNQGQMIIKI